MSIPLPAERRSSLSFWGMSSPLSRAHGWACRSLLSGGVPSHSEEWVLHSPELVIGLTLRSEFSALELLIGSWVPLIPRNEFSALQSSPSVELALLPSTRGSPMSMPLPSERPSFSAPRALWPFWAAEFPLNLRNEFSAPQSSVIGRSPCWSS